MNNFLIIIFKIKLGFFEAVSDAIELSVFTPQHLSKIGLHDNSTNDYGSDMNFLMLMALRKVTYMPFAYIVDEVLQYFIYRYDIFLKQYIHFYFFMLKVEMACV